MSRNASGTYTLPSGNPVVSGTLIEASWANTTLSDIASALTDSLSRSGEGGMTAALRLYDGTSSVPGLAWVSEVTTGWYRAGAGDMRLVVTGSEVMRYLSTGITVTGTLGASGNFAINTNKFTVAAASGNTAVAGTLDVTGNATVGGTLAITGALTLTANPILSAGTANGVAYLNASKVLTTGSALTFDGTELVSSTGIRAGSYMEIRSNTSTLYWENAANSLYWAQKLTGSDFAWDYFNGSSVSEQMRLTSTGLGIGTSSPSGIGKALNVYGASGDVSTVVAEGHAGAKFLALYSGSSSNDNGAIYSNQSIRFGYATSKAAAGYTNLMTLDTSGNLGLGVTPSAWWNGRRAFQLGNTVASIAAATSGNALEFGFNRYLNSSVQETYVSTGAAALYTIGAGAHYWYNAPSGTAGAAISFTQAMTLDASGNLGLGVTSPLNKLSLAYSATDFGASVLVNNTASGAGSVASTKYVNASSSTGLIIGKHASGFSDSNLAFINQETNAPLAFFTNNTERARIDSSGNLLVGKTTSNTNAAGAEIYGGSNAGVAAFTVAGRPLYINRLTTDGMLVEFAQDSTTEGSISVSGNTVSYNTSSDYRLKDNQQPLTGSGDFIDALKPKTWDWKADGSKGVGFIAHEVQEVSPTSVVGEKDGEQMQAMEYGSAEFIANIVAELQSLRKRVAQLEAK